MRKAFTLIELMVSIGILSILMLFLYKSYAQLNKTNEIYSHEVKAIKNIELIKKVIYLDFTLALSRKSKITNLDQKYDIFFIQSSHSIYGRINPYIAYIVKDKKLYRLESLKEFKEYPLASDVEFDAELIGEVTRFRIYKSKEANKELYLVNVIFKNTEEVLLKIKVLNSI